MTDPTPVLTSLADVKKYLKISAANTDRDTILSYVICGIEQNIKDFCNTDFKADATDRTEYYDGDGSPVLLTRRYPIISITSLHDDPYREFTSNSLIASADYVTYNNQGKIVLIADPRLVLNDSSFSVGAQNIKLVYKSGYSVVPFNVILAIWIWCGIEFDKYKDEMQGVISRTVGDKTTRLEIADIPKDVYGLIIKYRCPLVK